MSTKNLTQFVECFSMLSNTKLLTMRDCLMSMLASATEMATVTVFCDNRYL